MQLQSARVIQSIRAKIQVRLATTITWLHPKQFATSNLSRWRINLLGRVEVYRRQTSYADLDEVYAPYTTLIMKDLGRIGVEVSHQVSVTDDLHTWRIIVSER